MLQPFAYAAVESGHVRGGDAFAVGRVSDDKRFFGGLYELFEFPSFHGHAVGHARAFGIGVGCIDRMLVDVVSVYFVRKFLFGRIVVIDTVEQFAVKVLPLLESERFAEDSGINVAGHERGLHEYGSRTAERVDEIRIALPSGQLDEARGQHFVDGRLYGCDAVSAQVEAFARGVERQGAVILGNMYVEFDVGVRDADVGPFTRGFAEVVHDGVLHLVGHELGVAEFRGIDHGVHGEGCIEVEVLFPVDGPHGGVDVVGVGRAEVLDGFEYAYGRAQAEVGPVHHFLVSGEGNHTFADLDVVCAELCQLLCQHFFQSLEGFGDKFELFHL